MILIDFVLAFVGTVAFSILFNVPKKYYLCCGLTGGAGYLVYCLSSLLFSAAVSSFFASVVIVLMSRSFAVVQKCPITIFLISGIFPIIPGASVYYTAYYLIIDELTLANQKGLESVKIAFAIVLGIVMILSIPKHRFLPKYQLHLPGFPKKGRNRPLP